MIQNWTTEHIRFMEDAARYGAFHHSLARLLLPYFPQGGHICDAGCGLGDLTLALAPHFQAITACDIASAPLERLKARAPENVHVQCCDIFSSPPADCYDGMVLCLFGHTNEILSLAKAQCRGPVAAIKRGDPVHRFTAKAAAHHDHAADLQEQLMARAIPFERQDFTLEFGQPFRNREDALAFFTLYGLDDPIQPAEVFHRLVPISHPEFSWYLPQPRRLSLIVFNSNDL